MAHGNGRITMHEVTDPVELAKAQAQRARADRNAAWLRAHTREVYARYRGKCVCIAGGEPFAADSGDQALAMARAAHPEDDGALLHYVPLEKVSRVYAGRR